MQHVLEQSIKSLVETMCSIKGTNAATLPSQGPRGL